MPDAIALLREDHEKVKQLFEDFESASESDKQRIAQEAIGELEVHAQLEEELFYPAVRDAARDDESLVEQAHEEHHVAELLMGELRKMKAGDPHFDAKFLVLAEAVRHHIEEEEHEMLPMVQQADVDFERLGQDMAQRKQELMQRLSNGRGNAKRSSGSRGKRRSQASSRARSRSRARR